MKGHTYIPGKLISKSKNNINNLLNSSFFRTTGLFNHLMNDHMPLSSLYSNGEWQSHEYLVAPLKKIQCMGIMHAKFVFAWKKMK